MSVLLRSPAALQKDGAVVTMENNTHAYRHPNEARDLLEA